MAWENRTIQFKCGCEMDERVFVTTEEELQRYKNICARSICKGCYKEPVFNTDVDSILGRKVEEGAYDVKGE